MARRLPSSEFWSGKRVLVTGHSGFKGGWMVHWLSMLGAKIVGFSLPPDTNPSMFDLTGVERLCDSRFGDLRDEKIVKLTLAGQPFDIVLHMAAQALVPRSMVHPSETFSINVQGTVNLLEELRHVNCPQVTMVVTSDKVYRNDGCGRVFREDDPLGGHDPYSASKAACDIAVQAFREAFFKPSGAKLGTVRGGNVIGGGDFSESRIVPDCVRATESGKELILRHPDATRPWQHVLDCLNGYLLFVESLVVNPKCPEALNIGPEDDQPISVHELASTMLAALGSPKRWKHVPAAGSVEAPRLALDPTLAKNAIEWENVLSSQQAINLTAQWYGEWKSGNSMQATTIRQIVEFTKLAETPGNA